MTRPEVTCHCGCATRFSQFRRDKVYVNGIHRSRHWRQLRAAGAADERFSVPTATVGTEYERERFSGPLGTRESIR